MIWLSYYSRWQTLILNFACFVDFLLVSFQHLILGMICAINEKLKVLRFTFFFFLEILVCVKLLMIFVSVFWLSPCPAPGIKESPSRTWASSWGSGTSGDVEIMLAEHLFIRSIICIGDGNKDGFWKWVLFVVRILLEYWDLQCPDFFRLIFR